MTDFTDKQRLDFLEDWARRSHTGISIDWVGKFGQERHGFRFMRYHHISEPSNSARDAIDAAMTALALSSTNQSSGAK